MLAGLPLRPTSLLVSPRPLYYIHLTHIEPPHPDSLEPCFQPGTCTWHAISQSLLTEPKVSFITLQVYEIEMWGEQWLDMHRGYSELGGGEGNGEGVLC
jgi:hypothetical protein